MQNQRQTGPRERFAAAYRAARLTPHKFAALAAYKGMTDDTAMFSRALTCWVHRHEWLFGLQAVRTAASEGRSRKLALRLNLRAVKYRRANRTSRRPNLP